MYWSRNLQSSRFTQICIVGGFAISLLGAIFFTLVSRARSLSLQLGQLAFLKRSKGSQVS